MGDQLTKTAVGKTSRPDRPRNDPAQYDDLVHEWWRPKGEFAALHWLAASRSDLIPSPYRPGAILLDLGCGGGLMAPYVSGYCHVGLDLTASALAVAADRGVLGVKGDIHCLPFRDEVADVVVAGEIFEHISDVVGAVAEIARVLRPGGTVVFDTINDTTWSRLSLVVIGERLPGGPPRRIHDPCLFVAPEPLTELFKRHGIEVHMRGLRVSVPDYIAFLFGRRQQVRMLPTRSLAGLYQGSGLKASSQKP